MVFHKVHSKTNKKKLILQVQLFYTFSCLISCFHEDDPFAENNSYYIDKDCKVIIGFPY